MAVGESFGQAFIPQELLQEMSRTNNRLLIGVPRERSCGERRIALTPEGVDILTNCGHQVFIEAGAGLGINYSDTHFAEAGATIVETPDEIYQSDIIIKILPPLPEEVALMKPRTVLLSMIQFNLFDTEAFHLMMEKRVTAISYELMADEKGTSPILNTISEIEGATSITIASNLLSNIQGGKGILLGGIPGVPPTEVVILGAGMAGTAAARAALSLGALVKVFDDDINKLRTLQNSLGQKIFTSNFHPNVLQKVFKTADVVIGSMHYIKARRHYIISEELIRTLKRGALIIDLRISQGGCFETTCGLTDSDPTVFEQFGVLHYCKPNISNYVARTTSMAFSNQFVPLLLTLGDARTIQMMIKTVDNFRNGVYMYHGKSVNDYVSSHFNIISGNLDIYLAAF